MAGNAENQQSDAQAQSSQQPERSIFDPIAFNSAAFESLHEPRPLDAHVSDPITEPLDLDPEVLAARSRDIPVSSSTPLIGSDNQPVGSDAAQSSQSAESQPSAVQHEPAGPVPAPPAKPASISPVEPQSEPANPQTAEPQQPAEPAQQPEPAKPQPVQSAEPQPAQSVESQQATEPAQQPAEPAQPVEAQPAEPQTAHSSRASRASRSAHRHEWNAMAITGFVLSFFGGLVGLILSLVGLNQIKRTHERGRSLAVAGIIIGVLMTVTLFVASIWGVVWLANRDNNGSTTTTSQSSSAQDSDTKDDSSKDDAETNSDDKVDSVNGMFDNASDMLNYPEMQRQVQQEVEKYKDMGITASVTAQGSTITYDLIVPDTMATQSDILRTSVEGQTTSYQSIANLMSAMVKGDNPISVRVFMHTQSGSSIFDKTFTGQ